MNLTLHETLQFLIGLGGLAAQIYVGYRERSAAKLRPPSEKLINEDRLTVKATQRRRRFLDLAFVLLFAAFITILITDALIISGRSPELWSLMITAGMVSIVVSVSLILLARIGKGEFGVGCWAIISFLLIVFAKGGPFGMTGTGTFSGPALFIPLTALLFISITMLLYEFGNPLNPRTSLRNKLIISGIITLLISIGSANVGKQKLVEIFSDPRTPKVTNQKAKELLRKLLILDSKKELPILYQFLSEVHLASTYIDHYEQYKLIVDNVEGDNGVNIVNDEVVENKAGDNIVSDEKEIIYLCNMLNEFFTESLKTTEDIASFIMDRLSWVHPVMNSDKTTQINLAIPGLTAQKRLSIIEKYRIRHAVAKQQNLRRRLHIILGGDAYEEPPPVISIGPLKISPSSMEESTNRPDIFAVFSPSRYTRRIISQLALPQKWEGALGMLQYRHFVKTVFANIYDANRIYSKSADDLIELALELDGQKLTAIRNHILQSDKSEERIHALALLDQEHVEVLSLLRNTTERVRVAENISLNLQNENDVVEWIKETQMSDEISDKIYNFYNFISKLAKDEQESLLEILRSIDPQSPVVPLFNQNVVEVLRKLVKEASGSKTEILSNLVNPILPVLQMVLSSGQAGEKLKESATLLHEFMSQSDISRERLLHFLATRIYRIKGEYALDPLDQLIAQATNSSQVMGIIASSAIWIPFFLFVLWFGGIGARHLSVRSSCDNLVDDENSSHDSGKYCLGKAVDVYGRKPIIKRLKRLLQRGWGTIALVGRRGIGKTRILHEVYAEAAKNDGSVGVWISAPTQFTEKDFIKSVLERVSLSIESSIAQFLGANPFAARVIEAKSAKKALWLYLGSIIVLCLTLYNDCERLSSPQVVLVWMPFVILMLASFVLLIVYLIRLHPIDLSRWLARDRSPNPHTALLYEQTKMVLDYLRSHQTSETSSSRLPFESSIVANLFFTASGAIIVAFILEIIFSLEEVEMDGKVFLASVLPMFVLFYLMRRRPKKPELKHRDSLMSLIATYREFGQEVINRLRHGALGNPKQGNHSVVVCIDELDKIIDFKDTRSFIRRVKAIFDLPGFYYYLSMSEDAIKSFVLGVAEGKDEIDSSFDHMVPIPMLRIQDGATIVTTYIQQLTNKDVPFKLAYTIAAMGFGLPRDILRRCDEVMALNIAWDSIEKVIVRNYRISLVEQAYSAARFRELQRDEFLGIEHDAVRAAIRFVESNGLGIAIEQNILIILLLCLLEIVVCRENEFENLRNLEIILEFSYRLANEQPEVMRKKIIGFAKQIMN